MKLARSLRQPLQECCFIVLVAILLGFSYTALHRRGIFAESQPGLVLPATPPKNIRVPHERNGSQNDQASTFITYDQALQFFHAGTALFIDSRHEYDYALGHIKGAINIPLNQFDAHAELIKGLPKDKLLITYCDGVECNSSVALAQKLITTGFFNVKVFFGGWNEWEADLTRTERVTK